MKIKKLIKLLRTMPRDLEVRCASKKNDWVILSIYSAIDGVWIDIDKEK